MFDPKKPARAIYLTIVVAALGYFVDIYDLILFSVVRQKSLQSIGVPRQVLLDTGVLLLNMQMSGMVLGGILWGSLGDKRGRLSVLFGSIALYSIANIANGLVQTVPQYALLRLVAGIGLAGELGAGITLVSEIMPRKSRGYGTTLIATVGILGAVVAAQVGNRFAWRTAYFIGGGLGLGLLALRIGIFESGMFEQLKERSVQRGNFFSLFLSRPRAIRYLSVIMVGIPIWYGVGILVTFSPEIGAAMGMHPAPNAGAAVMFTYIGLAIGDLTSGALSQLFQNRKRIVGSFLALTAAAVAGYFTLGSVSLAMFYTICLVLGFATGYWAVFVTIASEQFGTNIRATATTTAPNFVRGAVVPLTSAFRFGIPHLGIIGSALTIGIVVLLIALGALWLLEETYGKDLDFVE